MRVLGIDTSLRSSGFAILEKRGQKTTILDCGIIKNEQKLRHSECLTRIFYAIEQLIYEYNPDEVAIESPFYAKNAKTAMILGMAKGVVITSSSKAKLPIYEYAPKKAKQAVVGHGNASKHQVAVMMTTLLGVDIGDINDDATDAMALAFCHLQSKQLPHLASKKL